MVLVVGIPDIESVTADPSTTVAIILNVHLGNIAAR